MTNTVNTAKIKNPNLQSVNIEKFTLHTIDSADSLSSADGGHSINLPQLSLWGGVLHIDGQPVHAMFSRDTVYWERTDENGISESGLINLSRHGLFADGYIKKNTADTNTHEEKIHFKADTEIRHRLLSGGLGGIEMELTFGSEYISKHHGSNFYVKLDYIHQGEAVNILDFEGGERKLQHYFRHYIGRDGLLHFNINLSQIWHVKGGEMPEGFDLREIELGFSGDLSQSKGFASKVSVAYVNFGDSEIPVYEEDKDKKRLPITGKAIYGEHAENLQKARARFNQDADISKTLKENYNALKPTEMKFGGVNSTDSVNTVTPMVFTTAAVPPPVAVSSSYSVTSVDSLFALTAPKTQIIKDADGKDMVVPANAWVQREAIELMHDFAVNQMADTEQNGIKYSDLLGQSKQDAYDKIMDLSVIDGIKCPDIADEINKLAADEKVRNYLTNYTKAALGHALSTSVQSELSDAFKDIDKAPERCVYYMQDGSSAHTDALSRDPGYNLLYQAVTKYIYAKNVPGFIHYYAEQKSGKFDWAKALYEYALTEMPLLRIEKALSAGRNDDNLPQTPKITHIYMLLNMLDDSAHPFGDGESKTEISYGALLYAQFTNYNIAELLDTSMNLEGNEDFNVEEYSEMIIRQILGEIYGTAENKYISEENLQKVFGDDLQEFQKMSQESATNTQIIMGSQFFAMGKAFSTIVGLFSALRKGSSPGAGAPAEGFFEKPGMIKFGKVMGALMSVMQIAFMGVMLANWKSLTKEQKALTILSCVDAALNSVVGIARTMKYFTLLNPNSTEAEISAAADSLRYGAGKSELLEIDAYEKKAFELKSAQKEGVPAEAAEPTPLGEGAGLKEYTGNLANDAEESMSTLSEESAGEVVEEQINYTAIFFKGLSLAIRVINFAVFALMTAISIRTVIQEFKMYKGAQTSSVIASESLDIIAAVAMFAATVCEIISLVVDIASIVLETTLTVLSCIPIIGAIAMIVNFVVMIVQMILGFAMRKDPPVVAFTKNQIAPFVAKLPVPPEVWLQTAAA